jgi:hypothetical protein
MFISTPKENEPSPGFLRPVAVHKARWMAKLLYSIKISLLQHQLQGVKGFFTSKAQASKIRDFVIFVTLIYCKWWLSCPDAIDAPMNDLALWKKLNDYKRVNRTIGESALKALERHLWYLAPEMVPLALFCSSLPNDEQQAIATQLITLKPEVLPQSPSARRGTGFGKPIFPKLLTSLQLADLITEDSWFFFSSLGLDSDFLALNVTDWKDSESYQSCLPAVKAINVINDAAERGVKMSADFIGSARNETNYQNTLQVVQENRRLVPNLRKS